MTTQPKVATGKNLVGFHFYFFFFAYQEKPKLSSTCVCITNKIKKSVGLQHSY